MDEVFGQSMSVLAQMVRKRLCASWSRRVLWRACFSRMTLWPDQAVTNSMYRNHGHIRSFGENIGNIFVSYDTLRC